MLKKRVLVRWLCSHGFWLEPHKPDGHARWTNGRIRLQMVAHGGEDMPPNHVLLVVRKLEEAGYERKTIRRELGVAHLGRR